MRLYKIIFEDRDNVYREFIPAMNDMAAEGYVVGNGEIISTKDVTEDFPISLSAVSEALKAYGFGRPEQDLIIRMLQNHYDNTI